MSMSRRRHRRFISFRMRSHPAPKGRYCENTNVQSASIADGCKGKEEQRGTARSGATGSDEMVVFQKEVSSPIDNKATRMDFCFCNPLFPCLDGTQALSLGKGGRRGGAYLAASGERIEESMLVRRERDGRERRKIEREKSEVCTTTTKTNEDFFFQSSTSSFSIYVHKKKNPRLCLLSNTSTQPNRFHASHATPRATAIPNSIAILLTARSFLDSLLFPPSPPPSPPIPLPPTPASSAKRGLQRSPCASLQATPRTWPAPDVVVGGFLVRGGVGEKESEKRKGNRVSGRKRGQEREEKKNASLSLSPSPPHRARPRRYRRRKPPSTSPATSSATRPSRARARGRAPGAPSRARRRRRRARSGRGRARRSAPGSAEGRPRRRRRLLMEAVVLMMRRE